MGLHCLAPVARFVIDWMFTSPGRLFSAEKVNPSNRERAASLLQQTLWQPDLKVPLVKRSLRRSLTGHDPNVQPQRAVRCDGALSTLGQSGALDDIANVVATR